MSELDVASFLAGEAEEAEAVADAEERGERLPTPGQRARRQAVEPAQVYSVRIPVEQLEALRIAAVKVGKAPSALMREWVIERLSTATSDAATEPDDDRGPIVRTRDGVNLGRRRRPLTSQSARGTQVQPAVHG